jgi:Uma2 family endonuclease
LSPEDTIRRAAKKVADYLRFGIEHVWVIDPHARVAYRGTTVGLERIPGGELIVPGTPIAVRVSEIFEKLDQIRARGQR